MVIWAIYSIYIEGPILLAKLSLLGIYLILTDLMWKGKKWIKMVGKMGSDLYIPLTHGRAWGPHGSEYEVRSRLDCLSCVVCKQPDVSQEFIATMFKVEEQAKQETNRTTRRYNPKRRTLLKLRSSQRHEVEQ
jgi:hypothetical protein